MSDLDGLVADLGKIPSRTLPNVRKAFEVAARNVKDGWTAEAEAANPGHAKRYPRAISYDIRNRIGSITAEIGPELGGQGSLGIIEDAAGGVAAAPQRNWERPLREAEDDLAEGLMDALGDIF